MEFKFNGTLDELKTRIRDCAETLSREIVIHEDPSGTLEIGFLSLGRKGGRYYVATATERDHQTILAGTITNKDTPFPKEPFKNILKDIAMTLLGILLFYVVFGIFPWALWWTFRLPHVWLAVLLPAVPILLFFLPDPHELFKKEKCYDLEDEAFCIFMVEVCGPDRFVPTNTQELYQLLAETSDLHSIPQLEKDVILWELYDTITVKASIVKNSTLIQICSEAPIKRTLLHWHPEPEAIYGELCSLGRKGHILVLRKSLFGTDIFYHGHPKGYDLPKTQKCHLGKLIYLEQK